MPHTVSPIISDDTLSRAIQIESAGKVRAKAETSSASGLFQFLDATWIETVRKHGPDWADGLTRTQLLQKRFDAKCSIEMGARFWEDNAKVIGAGWADGDLYLAHFAGAGTAAKLFRAKPNADSSTVFSAAAIRANRSILAGKTCGQVRKWAAKRMRESGGRNWIEIYMGDVKPVRSSKAAALNDGLEEITVPDSDERQSQVSDAAVVGDPDVWFTQTRLKAMNYNPGGIDGDWGGLTAGAITGFLNDRGSGVTPPTSAAAFEKAKLAIRAEIGRAEAENFKRPVSAARASGDIQTVAATAPEVVPVRQNFLATAWAAVVAFFTGMINAVSDYIARAWNFFTDYRDDIPSDSGILHTAWGLITKVPTTVWFLLIAGVFLALALNARKGVQKITASVQTGERP